jgi:ABC-2 type transport system permease protein
VSAVELHASSGVTPRQLRSAFLSAEWIKLRTLRSTTITLFAAVLAAVGIGALACQHLAAQLSGLPTAGQRAGYLHGIDLASHSLLGNAIAQLAIGTLGVLVVTGEFGTGMIRASLAAMPQRQGWIAAKLAVFGAVALVMGQLLTFASFGIGQAILSGQHVGLSLGDPGALRSVVATGLYVALIGLMGAAFGLIIRHTAGALTTLLGVLFILPALIGILPTSWQPHVSQFLPETIGEQSASASRLSEHLAPWIGIAMMVGYVAVLLAIGCTLLQRRDA